MLVGSKNKISDLSVHYMVDDHSIVNGFINYDEIVER